VILRLSLFYAILDLTSVLTPPLLLGEDTNQSSSPPIAPLEAPQMVSSVKLPILEKVILNGNGKVQMTKDEAGNEVEAPPVTTQQILARTRERKAKSSLIMAIPDEHLARFYGIKDAKTLWAAIKTRFDEGLDKGYDRFQRLLSLLEIHEACVSIKDANQKFLRSLPLAWSNISLIIRNKPGIDNLDIDDLYNNLKVYEDDIKGSSGSSSNSKNVAFVFAESPSSINKLNAAYSVSTTTCHSSQAQGSSSYVDELMFSFFSNQSSSPQLDNKDLQQINQD
nr:ribonuclease H-like domain-containing protein [Tanacetum cinerariifolium]